MKNNKSRLLATKSWLYLHVIKWRLYLYFSTAQYPHYCNIVILILMTVRNNLKLIHYRSIDWLKRPAKGHHLNIVYIIMSCIGKNLSRYVRYRDFYHLPRQTAIFLVFCDKPRFFRISTKNCLFKNNFRDKPRYFELYKSLFHLEFSSCRSKQFKYNKLTNCYKVYQSL